MRETTFIEQNHHKWAEYEQMLRDNRRDPDRLNDLFIQITDDLSYARTYYPNRSVRMYLNLLAQRIFHNIYKGKRFPRDRFRRFWALEVPQVFWEARKALLLSFCVFSLAFAIGVISSMVEPDFARKILGAGYVEMTLANIEKKDPMAVYKEHEPLGMSIGIAANNLFVALRTAIFGVLASIGTIFILLYNGIMVGAFQYFFVQRGLFWDSFLTIWIHGTLEISAIIVAGASGLVMGSGLLFPGTFTRRQAFMLSMRRGLKMFVAIVPVLVLAAFFEGFLTRFTQTPAPVRAAFILVSLAFVLWYFVLLPWQSYRRGLFKYTPIDKALPPDRAYQVSFSEIKSSGEVLSDAFTIVRRHFKTVGRSVVAGAALFTVALGIFSNLPEDQGFFLAGEFLGTLHGTRVLFSFQGMPYFFLLQLPVFAAFALMSFGLLEKEMPERRPVSPSRRLIAFAVTALPMPAFFLLMSFPLGWLVYLLGQVAFPVFGLWAAILYFETHNPFRAFYRAFALMKFGQALLLGVLVVNLVLLFFLFLDSGLWNMFLEFFSWMVPPGEGNVRYFNKFATAFSSGMVLYFMFVLLMLGSGLLYFSLIEINDAYSLRRQIPSIGQNRRIRGIARE